MSKVRKTQVAGVGVICLLAIFAVGLFIVSLPQPTAYSATPLSGATNAMAGSGGVTSGLFVKLSAAGTIVTTSAASDKVVGVCEMTSAANGFSRYAPVGMLTSVTSGEAIAVGDLLTAGTGGKAFVLDYDDGSNQRVAALALTAASGADESVSAIAVASSAETVQQVIATSGDATIGVPFVITFSPAAAGNLDYTVPTGKKLRVLDAYGFKTVGAGAHADDELTLSNNGANNIFAKEELNTIGDGARILFDTLDDAYSDVVAGNVLRLVALENAAGGCDVRLYVVCVWVTP